MDNKRKRETSGEIIIIGITVIFVPIYILGCITGWALHKSLSKNNDAVYDEPKDYIDAEFTY